MEQHYRALEQLMLSAPFVQKFDCTVRVAEGTGEFDLTIKDDLFHGAGAVHGALYFLALDNAAMLAANSLVSDCCVVTTGFTTEFLRPVSRGAIRASATVVERDDANFRVEAIAYDDAGNEIGRGSGTFVRSRLPLSDLPGYGNAGLTCRLTS